MKVNFATMKYQSSIIVIVALMALISCQDAKINEEEKDDEVKNPNIILLIGDGMGLSQLSTAYYYGDQTPSFSRFPVVGLINTSSSSHKITDSGAGATAFSIGKRSKNGAIGVGPDSLPSENIPELIEKRGYVSGLIATCRITHATPAAFFAHHPNRYQEKIIASQLHGSPVHFVAAGGYGLFIQDEVNYLDSLLNNGFIVDTTGINYPEQIKSEDRLAFLPGKKDVPSIANGRGDFSTKAFNAAIRYFEERDNSFFLMIEGAQIDWGGHDNNVDYLVAEMLDFEKVVQAALEYAERDGNTVVVVLADHETGGFTLGGPEEDYDKIQPTFSIPGHSASLIPVLAYGPGSMLFSGVYENTEVFDKIIKLTQ